MSEKDVKQSWNIEMFIQTNIHAVRCRRALGGPIYNPRRDMIEPIGYFNHASKRNLVKSLQILSHTFLYWICANFPLHNHRNYLYHQLLCTWVEMVLQPRRETIFHQGSVKYKKRVRWEKRRILTHSFLINCNPVSGCKPTMIFNIVDSILQITISFS